MNLDGYGSKYLYGSYFIKINIICDYSRGDRIFNLRMIGFCNE